MHTQKVTVTTYIIGFLLSIILTFIAYLLAMNHINSLHPLFSRGIVIGVFLILAFIQLTVQLVYFLHLGQEAKPRWNLIFFFSTFSIVLLVVVASLWIMYHLNYNMMPTDMNHMILIQEGLHK